MNNFRLDVAARGRDQLKSALSLVFGNRGKCHVVGYSIEDGEMILYWADSDEKGFCPLPFNSDLDRTVEWVWAWLEDQPDPPGGDGDTWHRKAWRVYNEDWGHVKNRWEALAAVAPATALICK